MIPARSVTACDSPLSFHHQQPEAEAADAIRSEVQLLRNAFQEQQKNAEEEAGRDVDFWRMFYLYYTVH